MLSAAGSVKWFNAMKGVGVIKPDDGGADVFVHISAGERAELRDLKDGQKNTCELISDRKSGKMSAASLQAWVASCVAVGGPGSIGVFSFALTSGTIRSAAACWRGLVRQHHLRSIGALTSFRNTSVR